MTQIAEMAAGDSLGGTLAAFACRADRAVPAALRADWSLHVADTLACAAAGAGLEIAGRVRVHALAEGNPAAGAPVIGAQARSSPMLAAFANAFAANALDFDDGFEHAGKGMGHPGASLVAAGLAALGSRRISGAEFLEAVIRGAEINNRLILSVQPGADRFHEAYGIGQHQAVGAAATYGRLVGLDPATMQTALGLAGSLTAVPSLHKYNWQERPIITLKDFVAPAAQAGVQAVALARAGLRGPEDIFAGPQGYWRMVGSDRFDPELLTGDLGRSWRAAEGSFKTYPACRWIAPVLEAFETAFVASGGRLEEIAGVVVHSFADVGAKMAVARPLDAIDAQFALPHLMLCIARGRPAGLPWFDAAALGDPGLEDFAARLRFRTDPDRDAAMRGRGRRPSARVQVMRRDGASFEHAVEQPLGGAGRPLVAEAVRRKAAQLFAQSGLDPERLLPARLAQLETCPDLGRALAPLFAAVPG